MACTDLAALGAADAGIADDIDDQCAAASGRTLAAQVGLVLGPEVTQRGEDGIRRGLAKPAEA
jgi:hypothetical protein